MNQPGDEKRRFIKTPQRGDLVLILIVCVILASFAYFGHRSGYEQGYSAGHADGIVENQPTIYQNGMTAGMEKWKNIDEIARNWTRCTWSWRSNTYCKNEDPDIVRVIKGDYSTSFEYRSSSWDFI
jgi:hypothetical protein